MNTLRKQVLIGLAALSMGTTAVGALAQTQPQPQAGRHAAMTPEQRQAKMADAWQKHMTKLHDALKLSSAQEPAWNTFAGAIKPQPLAGMPDRAAWAGMTAPQRMEKMIALSKERTTRMESHLAALNTFYAQLTPDQKKIFDQQTLRSSWEGERGGHGMPKD